MALRILLVVGYHPGRCQVLQWVLVVNSPAVLQVLELDFQRSKEIFLMSASMTPRRV